MTESVYSIPAGSLRVSNEDLTLFGEVKNVVVKVEPEDYDILLDSARSFKSPNRYFIEAEFLPEDDTGKYVTIAIRKTPVSHEATVEIEENDISSISKAVEATGAPSDASVEVKKGTRTKDLSDIWLVTVRWETK